MSRLAGPLLILAFALSQAVRDVWFGGVFQGYGFFLVVCCIFTLSSVLFLVFAAIFVPVELRTIWGHWRLVLWMNVTTAIAWTCYFFGLKHLEPSVVNTIHSGMGPLTVLALGALGAGPGSRPRSAIEAASYVGLGLSIALLYGIVLTGRSGLGAVAVADVLPGLLLLFVSGSFITMSLLVSKKLHDRGFGSIIVTAVRYLTLAAVSAALADWHAPGVAFAAGASMAGTLAFISALGLVLVVIPTFVLQLGIARTGALTAQVIRSLSPVFVFLFEQFDPRIVWSGPVLAAIGFYSLCVVGSNMSRGWSKA